METIIRKEEEKGKDEKEEMERRQRRERNIMNA